MNNTKIEWTDVIGTRRPVAQKYQVAVKIATPSLSQNDLKKCGGSFQK